MDTMIGRVKGWFSQRSHPIGETRTITATADDVANGEPGDARKCPFALAAARMFPDARVLASTIGIDVYYKNGMIETWADASGRLTEWMHRFDKRQEVRPATFTITRTRYFKDPWWGTGVEGSANA